MIPDTIKELMTLVSVLECVLVLNLMLWTRSAVIWFISLLLLLSITTSKKAGSPFLKIFLKTTELGKPARRQETGSTYRERIHLV